MRAQDGGERSFEARVALERVRVKEDLARARSSGPLGEIPSGRVFDEPPLTAASDANGAEAPGKAEAAEESASRKSDAAASHAVSDSADAPATTSDQAANVATTKEAPVAAAGDSEASAADATDDESLAGPASALLALTRREVVRVAPPPPPEPAPPSRVAAAAAAAGESGAVEQKAAAARTAPEENRPLNEYLISELELFAQVVRGETAPISARRCSRVIHATTLQLFYDHTRALRDFDAESQRSYLSGRDKEVCSLEDAPSVDAIAVASAGLNPFQRGASVASAAVWNAVLERTAEAQRVRENGQADDAVKIDRMHKRGLNGLVVASADRAQHRRKLRSFLVDDTCTQDAPTLHIVIASVSELLAWSSELAAGDHVQVYPYWGETEDRGQVLRLLHAEYYRRQRARAYVLLTSFDVFVADAPLLGVVQWQATVIDVPESASDQEQLNPVWMQLLGLRTRHRLLVAHAAFKIDTRRTLQFLLPGLFSSRRKLLAWNCAAFDTDMIHRMGGVVESFALLSEPHALRAFLAVSTQYSLAKSDQELTTLSLLEKSGLVRRGASSYMKKDSELKIRELFASAKGKTGTLASAKVKARRMSQDLTAPVVSHKKKDADAALSLQKKEADAASASRKRLGRCGKCTGCLAGDCMTCGHCQDMKKYGGPGLRKQSCKNRKCINPRRWGMAVRKRKRSKARKAEPGHDDGDEDASEKDESDFDDHDDGATSYYSQDSDHDSTFETSASHDAGYSDSDTHESARTPDRDAGEQLPDGDVDLKESRTRVMRCGKCSGCTASDCMECGHCLDKKKYGGPGLRKQSCKRRKCVARKVVLLNQSKDDEALDEKSCSSVTGSSSAAVGPDYVDSGGLEASNGAVLYRMNVQVGKRGARLLSVVQECEVFLDRHLAFACERCGARFSSRPLLALHERVEHAAVDAAARPESLEADASRLLAHPIPQLGFLRAQLRDKKIPSSSCPRAYAKLEGAAAGWQYFVMQPCVVLGRVSARWRELYESLGLHSVEGLASSDVDCHVGDSASVAERHALIAWSFSAKQFTVECLSVNASISVNGKQVRFDDEPLALASQSRIQLGSASFFFLLPKAAAVGTESGEEALDDGAEKESALLPRSELQAWLHATMRKRRASSSSADSLEQPSADGEVARVKKRCQERLASMDDA
ncbi:hypothetical protein PybrP1_012436 [[Pythium] brassicae (nom. inval.)]|nr:hypothetical protein PybrP1_012436 [[Pythium] brassicae (nom. inval.)]